MATISLRPGLVAVGIFAILLLGGSAVFLTRSDAPTLPVIPVSAPGGAPGAAVLPVTQSAVPTFDVVRVAPSGAAVLAGRAEPMATVTVQQNGRELGQVRADGRGEWVLLPPGPLAPGAQQLTLVARNGAGAEARSAGEVLLVVPDRPAATAVAAPGVAATPPVVADAVAPGAMPEMQTALAVLTPPSGPVQVLQGAGAPRGRLTLEVIDYDSTGQIRFAGAAAADASVRLYVDNVAVGDARTGKDGRWSLEPGALVKPGVHAVRVDQVGVRGRVASRVEMPFQRADTPSLEPGRVVVQPGQNLWRIARSAYGSGVRYLVIFRANQDQIRDPDRIYPGQAFDVPSAAPVR